MRPRQRPEVCFLYSERETYFLSKNLLLAERQRIGHDDRETRVAGDGAREDKEVTIQKNSAIDVLEKDHSKLF